MTAERRRVIKASIAEIERRLLTCRCHYPALVPEAVALIAVGKAMLADDSRKVTLSMAWPWAAALRRGMRR